VAWVRRLFGQTNVDVCVIGSGPYNLVRAIQEVKQGRSVLIVERQPVLGGAWAARPCFDDGSLHDVVAHLMAPFPTAYDLLSRAGFKMLPRPIFFWDAVYSEDKKNALLSLADDSFQPFHTDTGHIMAWHQYYGLLKWPLGIVEAHAESAVQRKYFVGFRYFERSFQPLIDRLVDNFERQGGRYQTLSDVKTVRKLRNRIEIGLGLGVICCKKIISGRHLDCEFLGVKDKLAEEIVVNEYNSLMIRIRATQRPAMMYVNAVNHSQIGAIQIAPYDDGGGNEFVICLIGSFDQALGAGATAKLMLNQLKSARIIDPDSDLLGARYHTYRSYSHSAAYFKSITNGSPMIEINIVGSISQCIAENLSNWEDALL
jgi:hypothetical protein